MEECDGRETENESFLFICEEKSQNFEKKRKILKVDLIYNEIMKADKKRRDQKTRNRNKKGQATLDVPAAYDLLWEMAWEDSSIDLDQWIEYYTIRRYGAYSENAVEAWMYLKDSVYSSSRGTVSNLMSQNPDLNLSLSKIKYSEADLEKAFLLLMKDYDVLSQSEGYLFDLEEIASQIIRNNQYSLLGEVRTAYNDKDLDAFAESKERLLDSFDLLDAIAQMSSSTLLGEWIGKAEDYAENYDDFSMDMFRINAKAMLTTWKNSVNTGLIDYAARNYNGLIKDVYKQVWSQYLDSLEENLRNGTEVEKANKYELYWAWVLDDKEYTRETLSDTVEIKALMEQVSEEMMSIDQDDLTYFAAAEANYEIASDGANGGYAKYAIDDSLSSYWDGGSVENEPTLIIDLKDDYHLDQIQVIPYYAGNDRYYHYEVYVSSDKLNWEKVAEKLTDEIQTQDGETFDVDVYARYVKIVGLYNSRVEVDSKNDSFHIAECNIKGTAAVDKDALNDQIAAAEQLKAEDYTENSWAAMQEALTAAKAVAEDSTASQAEIDQATAALSDAVAALEEAIDDTASDAAIKALQAMVEKANALGSDDAALQAAIEAAQAVLDEETPSATAVVTALLNLSEAMQAVNAGESVDALREDVQATIDFINENILNDTEGLRPAKVQALRDAVKAAQDVVDDPDASADELKAANKAMTKAAQELWEIVTKAELEALIEAANGYLLQAAITAAQTVANNDDATTSEVTDAITDLANAIAGLESITLDTSALEHEIELVTEMVANINSYVPSTVEGLADKLADAQAAMNATTQEEIDAAAAVLREARLNARTKADVSALEELIAYVNSLELSAYTSASAQPVIQDLARAKAMLANEEVTQEEVNGMIASLRSSVDNLVEVSAESTTTAESDTTNTAAAMQTGMFAGLLAASSGLVFMMRRRRQSK